MYLNICFDSYLCLYCVCVYFSRLFVYLMLYFIFPLFPYFIHPSFLFGKNTQGNVRGLFQCIIPTLAGETRGRWSENKWEVGPLS